MRIEVTDPSRRRLLKAKGVPFPEIGCVENNVVQARGITIQNLVEQNWRSVLAEQRFRIALCRTGDDVFPLGRGPNRMAITRQNLERAQERSATLSNHDGKP